MSSLTVKTVVRPDTLIPNVTRVTVKSVNAVGLRGPAGIIMSSTPPADTSVLWADTSGL